MKTALFNLSDAQKQVIDAAGHLLITGGPGSGKTTISILKAEQNARELECGQQILFLSFARATVSRVFEAIEQYSDITKQAKAKMEIGTYHSFFWRIIKTHGYLIGLPRKILVLAPPAEAVALSAIHHKYKAESKLTTVQKEERDNRIQEEKIRLANIEGRISFSLFANYVAEILKESNKIRQLISTTYPYIVLDEFQDTNPEQWDVVKSLGKDSTLVSLADPEQRIFDFIGADPERLNHFKTEFFPTEVNLQSANHRSQGTDIAIFGNDILKDQYRSSYNGVEFQTFDHNNSNQAFAALKSKTLQSRNRLIKSGKRDWSLAILVPTKKMMRQVSDSFNQNQSTLPVIYHTASIDVHGVILAAEILGFFLQPKGGVADENCYIDLLCNFFQGKGGEKPSKKDITTALSIKKAYVKLLKCHESDKAVCKKSIIIPILDVYKIICELLLSGDPEADWKLIRSTLEKCACPKLKQVAEEARNLRLLNRGTQLRELLSQCWRDHGAYKNVLDIMRNFFTQEYFAIENKSDAGIVIMNMHKAKGKQFDEVIIFEGWPKVAKGKIISNANRIVKNNLNNQDLINFKYNFRVSVTRAKSRITILTPKIDPCILLESKLF